MQLTPLGRMFPEVVEPTVEITQERPPSPNLSNCQHMTPQLSTEDGKSLSKDQDLIDLLRMTIVSQAVAEQCRAELSVAKSTGWRL